MPKLPTKAENPDGLHQRYLVANADGSPTPEGALFFVLRLDNLAKNKEHVKACRKAAQTWCENAPRGMERVAEDLARLLRGLENEKSCDSDR